MSLRSLVLLGIVGSIVFGWSEIGRAQSLPLASASASNARAENASAISDDEKTYWQLNGKSAPVGRVPWIDNADPTMNPALHQIRGVDSNESLRPSQSRGPFSTSTYYDQQNDFSPEQLAAQQQLNGYGDSRAMAMSLGCAEDWACQLMPAGLMYRSYLASDRESRFRSYFFNESEKGGLWDITLGGRVALWRYGTTNPYMPEGWEVELEGAALPRLNLERDRDLESVDFRAGLPIIYAEGASRTKFGYYHTSSHLGDEFILRTPGFQRWNYSRDVLVLGRSYNFTPSFRIYGEMGWAFYADVAQEWEFQFGFDYAPMYDTGPHGAPFVAANGHLREEVNYSGNLILQAGWAWRSGPSAHLFRLGVEYFNGLSDQYQLWNQFEEKIGAALWYDF